MKVRPRLIPLGLLLCVISCLLEQKAEFVEIDAPPLKVRSDQEPSPAGSAEFRAGQVAYKRKDYAAALPHFRAAAEAGEVAAMRRVGFMIMNGLGTSEPKMNAEGWFRKAAQAGDHSSEFNLALLYYVHAKPRDCDASVSWLKKASAEVPQAGFELGQLYITGDCVPKDRAKSAAWRHRAAQLGHVESQLLLSLMYARGDGGLPRDYVKQIMWVTKAAEQGDPEALHILGVAYSQAGRGVTVDYARGNKLLHQAQAKGNRCAALYLSAKYYEGGKGVPRDRAKAKQLLETAVKTPKEKEVVRKMDFSERGYMSKNHIDFFVESFNCSAAFGK